MTPAASDSFFERLPVFTQFEGVALAENYQPLPNDWILATADIVGSTSAIAEGQYKAVNMAGASVISAVLNAVGRKTFPFVFGGDGALVALPGGYLQTAKDALAAVQAWVSDELHLTLRAAIVPMEDVRAQGLDVRVARFGASPDISYAMLTGGGASWAEAQMKAGRYVVQPSPAGTRPDLTGLSCRWNPIQSHNGQIVSIIAVPASTDVETNFQELVGKIIGIAAEERRASHPLPEEGPPIVFNLRGIGREARAAAPAGKRFFRKLAILGQVALTYILDKTGRSAGGFNARTYRQELAQNSDFRKFDDGLKMTIDIDAPRLARIEQVLEEASSSGVARYGLHKQDSALLTCFVPVPMGREHIHFIDGAAGGYAMAANNLKAKLASPTLKI